MSTVTPTLIPRLPALPSFLPTVPTPHPTPLPLKPGSGGILARRNLVADFECLSEEEEEVESKWKVGVQNRGFNHLRVIGRLHTRQEERNDADADDDDTNSAGSGDRGSIIGNEGENPSEPGDSADGDAETEEQDLDASMEDLDAEDERDGAFGSSEAELDGEEAEDE